MISLMRKIFLFFNKTNQSLLLSTILFVTATQSAKALYLIEEIIYWDDFFFPNFDFFLFIFFPRNIWMDLFSQMYLQSLLWTKMRWKRKTMRNDFAKWIEHWTRFLLKRTKVILFRLFCSCTKKNGHHLLFFLLHT